MLILTAGVFPRRLRAPPPGDNRTIMSRSKRTRVICQGMFAMWTTKTLTARALIWLAVFTLPLQAVPAPSCGCTGSRGCCQKKTESESQPCCCSQQQQRQRSCCCARQQSMPGRTCCGRARNEQDVQCNCGADCQCRTPKAPIPATLPVQNNSTEKVQADLAFAIFQTSLLQSKTATLQNAEPTAGLFTKCSLNRCISLCRFIL